MRSFIAAMGLSLVVAGGNLSVAPYRSPQLYGPAASDPSWLLSIANPPEPEPVAVAVETGGEWHPPEYARAPHMLPYVLDVLPQARPAAPVILASEAARHVGKGPHELALHRLTLWCATAVNKILADVGLKGTGSDWAKDFEDWGRATKPKPGAIAVAHRKCGKPYLCGHVAIVKRVKGNTVTVVSPNGGGNKVRLVTYPVKKFHAYREPVT